MCSARFDRIAITVMTVAAVISALVIAGSIVHQYLNNEAMACFTAAAMVLGWFLVRRAAVSDRPSLFVAGYAAIGVGFVTLWWTLPFLGDKAMNLIFQMLIGDFTIGEINLL